jgi:heat-inducible transcriptional repressor
MASGYQNQGSEVAKLGVLGPLRMDYSAGITNVSAVAGYLSKVLAGRV